MMKFKYSPFLASLIIGSMFLTACSDSKEHEATLDQVSASAQDVSEPNILIDYQFVGNDSYGYMQIPEDFKRFITATNRNDDTFIFASPDEKMIVSFELYSKAATLKNASKKIADDLNGNGEGVEVSPIEINGMQGSMISKTLVDEDYHIYVYILQGKQELRYISIEFEGNQEDVRDNIVNSYMEQRYAYAEPTPTNLEVTKSGLSNLTETMSIFLNDSDLNASVFTKELDITEIATDMIAFKLYGDFKEGQEYFVSVEDPESAEFFGNFETTPKKDNEGTYLEGTILSENKFTPNIMYHIATINLKSMAVPNDYAYFMIH